MSYDLQIGLETVARSVMGGKFVRYATPELDSPTYNLGEMLRAAMGWDFTQGGWCPVTEVIGCIRSGRDSMALDPERYRKYEPSNHWGTVEDAIATLDSLLECINECTEMYDIRDLWVRW